ncbi:Hsp20/alpha crystallin family protein [Candidatus Nitrosopumilus salaria BD31]|uniref:Hsp20/alpha crystallin family protein n=1 Tax=Candidatus Nitrosopumilus salarius BD31 TaxID=859350 RepID=I3D027_9ARCH|nr:Hsp20/alpha crystallin family protein [Candidatus Nitrosopumilus salaria]EIJ65070.1 Hsp20/alpha crystallin family protein [Candidatus Nitrosopumilus salaria BD31]
MAKTKKPTKTSSAVTPSRTSSWFDIDKSIENLRKEMEKAFSSFPSISMPTIPHTSCDIIDEGNQFRVKMDTPGIKKNELKLNVTDNSIEVTGEHKEEEKKKNYLRKERHSVSYYQTIPLSEKIIPGKVKAKLTDGVLDITLPKTKPTPAPKKRSVNVQ